MNKIVCLTSGGMDSAVMLRYLATDSSCAVRAISFDYGQRHRKELKFARLQAVALGVPYLEVDLSDLATALPGSSQTDPTVEVPEGHYAEESMKATVVPNRNMILLAVAIGHAIAHDYNGVAYAAHAGDHTIYPDCRPEFANAMAEVAMICDWKAIVMHRPFIDKNKAEIVKIGHSLRVDFGATWSCYKDGFYHCGKCGTCVERKEAFQLAGVEDPTAYDA